MGAADMTAELNAYCRALARRLECPRAKRGEFLAETRRAAENFIEENPEAGFSDVERFLGEPEALARTYNETLGPDATERFRRGRRVRNILLLAAAGAVVVSAILYVVYLNHLHFDVDITREDKIIIYDIEEGVN